MNLWGGQMHLCNFGQYFDQCENGQNVTDCTGPGGTRYTSARLYSNFQIWSTRVFVRDSLMKVLPEKKDTIAKEVDPGEYGMESPVCRIICLFLFIMQIIDDLRDTCNIILTLIYVPSSSDSWLSYEPPQGISKAQAKLVLRRSELDYVRVRVNGMPRCWKFLYLIF